MLEITRMYEADDGRLDQTKTVFLRVQKCAFERVKTSFFN